MCGKPTIANAITASRVVCAVLLVMVPAFSVGFFALYLWCGVSDVLDGWLARRWGCSNALGARFDSVADAVFVFCVAIALVPALSWKSWMAAWMCVVAAVRVVSYAVGCWKYHTFSALHTRLNKLTGIVLLCVPMLYLLIGIDVIVVIACAVATVSAVEELVITLTSTELDRDIVWLGGEMSEANEHVYWALEGPVHYWVHLTGDDADANIPWLVFLHGLSADHTLFDPQVAYFKGRYPLLVWDAPAHAASRPCSSFSYRAGAQALIGIMDEQGIESAVFVGQSMGGYHIQALIAQQPERVRAFTGIDTCPFGDRYYSRSDLWWVRHMEGLCGLYPGKTLINSIAESVGMTEETRRNMQVALGHYSKAELCHLLGMGYGAFVRENRDIRIGCPTLILVGDSDKTGKVRAYCDAWAQATGFPEVVVPHAAHNSNFDNSAFVNDQIERFAENAVCDRGA